MTESYAKYLLRSYGLENVSVKILTVCLVLLTMVWVLYKNVNKKKYNLPPGPIGVPILGYIPFLGEEPFRELHRLKTIYGNVFSLYLGQTYVVILGDFEAVKDAFSKTATIDRPVRLFDFIPDGVGLSSVNGDEWSEQRKFCVKSMRDYGIGKEKWESMIQVEVDDFVRIVASFNGRPFDINKILISSVSNNMSYFVFGKRLPIHDPDRIFLDKALDDVMYSFNQSSLGTFFPVIRDIQATLGIGMYAQLYKSLKMFNNFVRKEVRKIKEFYKTGEHDNFIVDYLKEMDNNKNKSGHYFNETNMYGNVQALFTAGSDTTRTSIHWLLLIMANFPDIQTKVQNELDSVLAKEGQIRWSDRKKVPFTLATIMEEQRWRTTAPLNTSRIATEDIRIQNYDIPKGTAIIANNWGLHNDPKYWKNPEKFDPERFLSADKQVMMKLDSYNPFSFGRRNCPGETIAMMEILLYFAALMHNFTIIVPKGKKLNMKGKLGLTYQAMRQDLQFIPREEMNVIHDAKN